MLDVFSASVPQASRATDGRRWRASTSLFRSRTQSSSRERPRPPSCRSSSARFRPCAAHVRDETATHHGSRVHPFRITARHSEYVPCSVNVPAVATHLRESKTVPPPQSTLIPAKKNVDHHPRGFREHENSTSRYRLEIIASLKPDPL